jgi:hypothetical protein
MPDTPPNRSHGPSWGDRTGEPGAQPGPSKEIEPGASGGSGNTDAGNEGQPRDRAGRFSKQATTKRASERLASRARLDARLEEFRAKVLDELGGNIDATKEPLLDALCASKVRADHFRKLGRIGKFLDENERYIRLAYMLGLVKAGQHAEKPSPKEMPARDHAEWVAMRRKRKR